MIRVDGHYLYTIGSVIHPLCQIDDGATIGQVMPLIWSAEPQLDGLLNHSVYQLRTCRTSGSELLATISALQKKLMSERDRWHEPIEFLDRYNVTTQAKAFEIVLSAELQWSQLFLVTQKGAFDLSQLTENGPAMFAPALLGKVPDARNDAIQAARCIAFELPTAAAFHLHRLNETVLRRYYDVVTSGKPHPDRKSISAYVDALKNHQVGNKIVLGALSTLNSLHRNPVLHPEQALQSAEEAIALLGMVNTTITYMLDELPPIRLASSTDKNESAAAA